MQDRYAGDIGDFGKIALLQALQRQGLVIGVNWYRVKPLPSEYNADGTFKQMDGKYREIPEGLQKGHEELAKKLLTIPEEKRSTDTLEALKLIPGAVYYNAFLTVERREEWHRDAMEQLKSAQLIFMDPDNGLLVKSVGKKSARSVKYTFYHEVKTFLEQGKSVLIYNHRCRKPEKKYFHDICEKLEKCVGVLEKDVLKITFRRFSIRDYLAISANEDHRIKIQNAFLSLEQGAWKDENFCYVHRDTFR